MSTSRKQLLFEKYLQRKCSLEELSELVRLLNEDLVSSELDDTMKNLWELSKTGEEHHDVDWEKMLQQISGEAPVPMIPPARSKTIWYSAAAAAIVLTAGTLIFFYFFSPQPQQNTAVLPDQHLQEIPTARTKQTIHLPDGSTVTLNINSTLKYPAAFGGKTREVFLQGEGYFDIVHDQTKPFVVHSGNIVTRVLGTAFDIKAYPTDSSVEITVTRGKVQVMKNNRTIGTLVSNQQIRCSKVSGDFTKAEVDIKPVIAWKPAEVVFNDVSLGELTAKMAERFNLEFTFTDPVAKNCRVTATFSEEDLAPELLTVICGVTKTDYSISGNKVTITGKGCMDH